MAYTLGEQVADYNRQVWELLALLGGLSRLDDAARGAERQYFAKQLDRQFAECWRLHRALSEVDDKSFHAYRRARLEIASKFDQPPAVSGGGDCSWHDAAFLSADIVIMRMAELAIDAGKQLAPVVPVDLPEFDWQHVAAVVGDLRVGFGDVSKVQKELAWERAVADGAGGGEPPAMQSDEPAGASEPIPTGSRSRVGLTKTELAKLHRGYPGRNVNGSDYFKNRSDIRIEGSGKCWYVDTSQFPINARATLLGETKASES